MVQEWRRIPERGGQRITRFYLWLCLTLGRRLARPFLYPIAFYFYASAPVERRASRDYLGRVLQHKPSELDVFRHFLTFSTIIMDRLYFLAGRTEGLRLAFHGVEEFEKLLGAERGLLLVSAHFGSFEALRALAHSERRLPLKVLMYLENAQRLNALFDAVNPQVAKSVIALGESGSMLAVKEWIERGGVIGILGDRIHEGDKLVQVEFLHGEADFPLGPWLLAGALDVPVLLCFAVYQGKGRYDIHFEPMDEMVRFGQENKKRVAACLAEYFARRLAEYCHRAPYNWFNFYDFWGKREATGSRSLDAEQKCAGSGHPGRFPPGVDHRRLSSQRRP